MTRQGTGRAPGRPRKENVTVEADATTEIGTVQASAVGEPDQEQDGAEAPAEESAALEASAEAEQAEGEKEEATEEPGNSTPAPDPVLAAEESRLAALARLATGAEEEPALPHIVGVARQQANGREVDWTDGKDGDFVRAVVTGSTVTYQSADTRLDASRGDTIVGPRSVLEKLARYGAVQLVPEEE